MVGVWGRNLGRVRGRWSEEEVLAAVSVTAGGLTKREEKTEKARPTQLIDSVISLRTHPSRVREMQLG